MRLKKYSFILMSGLISIPAFSFDFELSFPTNRDFVNNHRVIRPAASGKVESGLYGMTRNNGTRFHEGVDIRAFCRDKDGRAKDEIFAAVSGRIAYICRENNGSYGKYIVIEHRSGNVNFYTLYAHLASIAPDLSEGIFVKNGQPLGIMGETSSVYKFPEGTEHLHFEIGLCLGRDSFLKWYNSTFPSDDKNLHSFWNGLNLAGLDPVDFFRASKDPKIKTFGDWLKKHPPALTIFVKTNQFPEILKASPGLLKKAEIFMKKKRESLVGWNIDFSWSGVPLSFEPIYPDTQNINSVKILNVNKKYLQLLKKRNLLFVNVKSEVFIGNRLKDVLSVIFGHKFG